MASSSVNGDVSPKASHVASAFGLITKLQTVCSHFLHPFIRLDPLPSCQGTATTSILVQWTRSKSVNISKFGYKSILGVNDQVESSNKESLRSALWLRLLGSELYAPLHTFPT